MMQLGVYSSFQDHIQGVMHQCGVHDALFDQSVSLFSIAAERLDIKIMMYIKNIIKAYVMNYCYRSSYLSVRAVFADCALTEKTAATVFTPSESLFYPRFNSTNIM
jgi:hypothetical protein